MRGLSALLFCAALPVTAGFAFSANAQGMQYNAPGATVPSMNTLGTGSTNMVTAVPTDMTREAALERQVRDLTNQLEQRDFQLRQLQQNFDKYSADTNMRLQALEGQLSGTITGTQQAPQPAPMQNDMTSAPAPAAPPMPTTPSIPSSAGSQQHSGAVGGTLVDPNGAFQPQATPQLGQITETTGTKPEGTITSGKPQGGTTSAAQSYDQAFADLQSGNAGAAQQAFTNFLTTYPTHPLAANAQYWLGESYFAQNNFPAAAKTFAKAFQEHPQGQKAPDALLKLSLTLDKMNKKDDACLTLGELGKRFPAGPAAVLRRATEESARMGCKA